MPTTTYVPEMYLTDGGNVYWLDGDVLYSAPMSADHLPLWDDGGEVDFYSVDDYIKDHCRVVSDALILLEKSTRTYRNA